MSPRRWNDWPKRLGTELNGVSGLAGVGGAAVGIAGWSLLAGTAALVLTVGGIAITVGAFGYAFYKATPPVMKRPADLLGRPLSLDQLTNVFPEIRTLAIIGPTQAGKTTLRNRLSFRLAPPTRTQTITAHVTPLDTTPESYLAILDGGGEKYPQQFKLAEICDYLCVMLDHNSSNTDTNVDEQRLSTHEAFLRQIRHHLDESNAPAKRWVCILFNKHDLWKSAPPAQQTRFTTFRNTETGAWQEGRRASTVDAYPHSNEVPDDIAHFYDALRKAAQQ